MHTLLLGDISFAHSVDTTDPLLHSSSQFSTSHTEGESGWALRGSSRIQSGDRVGGRGWCLAVVPIPPIASPIAFHILQAVGVQSSWGHLFSSHNHVLPFNISEVMLT